MPTTRRRVNLTLTELEERFLDAITTTGTPEHDAFGRYLGVGVVAAGDLTEAPAMGLADVVHVMLRMGMDRLEFDAAEISYAAEAEALTDADRDRVAALRRNFVAIAAQSSG